jgi:hypothetical protein
MFVGTLEEAEFNRVVSACTTRFRERLNSSSLVVIGTMVRSADYGLKLK